MGRTNFFHFESIISFTVYQEWHGGALRRDSKAIYDGSPGADGFPSCGKNEYAPEGEALGDIVESLAEDNHYWQEIFFNAWEKFQLNGYTKEELTEAPENGNLFATVNFD
jgi:hypothetical protein